MPFKKGQSGNLHGKPPGTKSKSTKELKNLINQFLSNNMDAMQENFDQLPPDRKLKFISELLKYAVPVQRATELNITKLSNDELNIIVDELLTNISDE